MDESKTPYKRVEASSEYEPDSGRWLWALEDTRRRTKAALADVEQAVLDWTPPQGENSIGTLLYHIAAIELDWLYADVLEGQQPCHFGSLPEQLAALNRSHMAIHTLMCEALLTRKKEAARYALLLDPLSAAICSPGEISALFDEMWEAEQEYRQPFDERRG